jgi:hypothetical protein
MGGEAVHKNQIKGWHPGKLGQHLNTPRCRGKGQADGRPWFMEIETRVKSRSVSLEEEEAMMEDTCQVEVQIRLGDW